MSINEAKEIALMLVSEMTAYECEELLILVQEIITQN